jgi:hypothetical protein
MMKKRINITSGQTLLIVLLIAAVILTVGLAIASYSITDIKISQQEEASARAFSAAEAGIEESLKAGLATDVTVGDITAKVTKIVQGNDKNFNFGGLTFASGELTNVWLIGHTPPPEEKFDPNQKFKGSKITICWGNANQVGAAIPPALEASLIYKDGANYKVIRAGFDPKNVNPQNGRTIGFESVDSSSGTNCGNLAFAKNIDLASGTFAMPVGGATPYLLRLKLLYNSESQPLAVSADNNLPNQGKCFDSSATMTDSNITRKIRQCQFYEAPPAIFDYVLFSGSSLKK